MARSRTVIVAGAGIGGLAAALALARAGFRVVVAERAPKLEGIGAGIQLTPNASRALSVLGVLDRLRERAVEARALVVASGRSGQPIVEAAFMPAADRAPWLLAARADLQQELYLAAADQPDIELEFAAEITDAAEHPNGVTAFSARGDRGTEHNGLALIGADGLWSATRLRLHPRTTPIFHGFVAWRTLIPVSRVPAPFAEPVVRLWLGPGAHLVHYPVSAGAEINVVAIFADPWRSEDWSGGADPAALMKAFESWAAAPRALLAVAGEFRRWALHDLAPLARWGKGAVTLLGDAAHPMLPFLAQGAAAALEDALVLGRRMKGASDVTAALRAYERERAPRTARLQTASRTTGAYYRMDGPLALARNFALRALGGEFLMKRNAWIYRYDTRNDQPSA
jgi:salicylate hydroxylase